MHVPELSPLVWVMVTRPNRSTVHAVDDPALYEIPPVPRAHTGVIWIVSPGNPRDVDVIVPNEPWVVLPTSSEITEVSKAPVASVALKVMETPPAAVAAEGVPEITPVDELSVSPAGSVPDATE